MARCKECIHYTVCCKESQMVRINKYTYDEYNRADGVENLCRHYMETDVVPRSEVEEIVKFKDMAYAELKSLFIEAKQEVAREIFELIDCAFSPVFDYNGYTIKEYIAEIKKKYIGE